MTWFVAVRKTLLRKDCLSEALEIWGWDEVERREHLIKEEAFPKALRQKGMLCTQRGRDAVLRQAGARVYRAFHHTGLLFFVLEVVGSP